MTLTVWPGGVVWCTVVWAYRLPALGFRCRQKSLGVRLTELHILSVHIQDDLHLHRRRSSDLKLR